MAVAVMVRARSEAVTKKVLVRGQLVIPETDGADRLVKYPVIFDSVREQFQGFRQFLTRWNTNTQTPDPIDDGNEQEL